MSRSAQLSGFDRPPLVGKVYHQLLQIALIDVQT